MYFLLNMENLLHLSVCLKIEYLFYFTGGHRHIQVLVMNHHQIGHLQDSYIFSSVPNMKLGTWALGLRIGFQDIGATKSRMVSNPPACGQTYRDFVNQDVDAACNHW